MAVQLYKLAISATVQTTVDTKPEVLKYFYILNPDDITGDVLTIPAASFTDENGDTVTTITEAAADNGYYMLFINGVLQQDALYTVSTTEVVVQDADAIEENATVILVVTNFAPEANSTVTVNT